MTGIVEYKRDLDSLLWDEYYGPVMNIVSTDMLENMKKDRMPYSYDGFQEAVGVTTVVEAYYHKGDDGKYHIQGQITVDEGKITKLYLNKALRK